MQNERDEKSKVKENDASAKKANLIITLFNLKKQFLTNFQSQATSSNATISDRAIQAIESFSADDKKRFAIFVSSGNKDLTTVKKIIEYFKTLFTTMDAVMIVTSKEIVVY